MVGQKLKTRLETLEREAAQKAQDGENSLAGSNDMQTPITLPIDNSQFTATIFDDSLIDISGMDRIDLVSSNGLGLVPNNDFYSLANNHSDMFLDSLSNDMAWSSELLPQTSLDSSLWATPFEDPATLADASYPNNISGPISNAFPMEWPASHTNNFQSLATLSDYNSAFSISTRPGQKVQIRASPTPQKSDKTPLQRHKAPPKPPGERDIGIEIMHHLRLDDTKEHQSLIKTAIARGHNIRDVLLAGLGALSNSAPPPPKTASLSLTRTSTLQAFLAIAKTMEMSTEFLYDEDSISPFYQNPDSLSKGVVEYSKKLIPNLRPVRAQILHAHHPCWDLIPFPSFRQRILSLNLLQPPPFDYYELKNDIFMNDGITCWRTGNKGTGQPWDMRSWEAEKVRQIFCAQNASSWHVSRAQLSSPRDIQQKPILIRWTVVCGEVCVFACGGL